MPAESALSFLKETRGLDSWTLDAMAKSLNVPLAAAKQGAAVLPMQGYVKPQGSDWTTTTEGHSVSASKMPRFSRESVEQAIKGLKQTIKLTNEYSQSPFHVTEVVAFGDFLRKDNTRVQAADVGISLESQRKDELPESARERRENAAFLKCLRNRSARLDLKPYEEWMSKRSHVRLL
jgi:hypothetical protein